jgi:tRNA dimethylallyltransferase
MKQKLLVIVGPTASGKSALGVELAHRFGGEIVSADSRQVYRGLDIGTGKITKREMKGVPHYLLDVASPKRAFSADDFVKKARAAIADISRRGKLPILVGGTGFYIDALVGRIALPDVPPDPAFRLRVNNRTTAALFTQLRKVDPERARAMSTPSERNNRVRIVRALEIANSLGKVPYIKGSPLCARYDVLWLGIRPADTALRERITTRLFARIRGGMVAEAKRLHQAGLSYKRMRELGLEYRSLARLLQNEITKEQLLAELESAIWRYARKQLGYWKRNKNIRWFKPSETKKMASAVSRWLKG